MRYFPRQQGEIFRHKVAFTDFCGSEITIRTKKKRNRTGKGRGIEGEEEDGERVEGANHFVDLLRGVNRRGDLSHLV